MSDSNVIGFPHGSRPGDPLPYQEVNPNVVEAPLVNPEAASILEDAYKLIEGDRHRQHGKAEKCMDEIAKRWTLWLGVQVTRHDVAMMMLDVKIARIKTGAYNRDCYVDGDGYLSLAGQFHKDEATPR